MSRIHEALKRAEQHAAAQQRQPALGSTAEASAAWDFAGTVAPTPQVVPSAKLAAVAATPAPVREPVGTPAPIATGSLRSPLTFEMLVERCAKPEWNPDPVTMLFFKTDENTFGADHFRTLGTRLWEMKEKTGIRKILVSSALPGEGKSFVAANLAQAMAQEGRRVLLIEANLRAPHLHSLLGAPPSPGLSDYLLGKNDEVSIVQQSPMEDLFFIPAGENVSNPAELMANARFNFLLQRPADLFDYVVMDSPAVRTPVTNLLVKVCDGVLMVVRPDSTPFHIAKNAGQQFPGKRLVGVVMNGANGNSSGARNNAATQLQGNSSENLPSLT